MCVCVCVCVCVWRAVSSVGTMMEENSAVCVPNKHTDGSDTKGTRAHTHRELIREWL